MEKDFYWLTRKQTMSNHVSWCQDMRFLLAFPQQLVNLRLSIELRSRAWKNKQTMWFVFPSPVAILKSHQERNVKIIFMSPRTL